MSAKYPNSVATDDDLYVAVNNTATVTALPIGLTDTTIDVATSGAFPSTGFLTIDQEAMQYSSKSGTTFLGVSRGADGTTPATHAEGAEVGHDFVAAHHNALKDEIEAMELDLLQSIRPNAYRNQAVNPGYEIWQRGISWTLAETSPDTYTADRWAVSFVAGAGPNTGNVQISREAIFIDSGRYSLKGIYTQVGTTAVSLKQPIEDYVSYLGKTVTFSVRVKTANANAVRLSVYDGTHHYSSYHTGSGIYETLSVTVAISGGATSIVLYVFAELPSIFYLDSAMFILGGIVIPYSPLLMADDLARCLRYYEINYAVRQDFLPIRRTSGFSPIAEIFVPFKTMKNIIPAVAPTISSVNLWQQPRDGSGNVADTVNWSASVPTANVDGFQIRFTRGIDETAQNLGEFNYTWAAEAD